MSTIKSLSEKFKCPINVVKEAARQAKFIALSDEYPIPDEKAKEIESTLRRAAPIPVSPPTEDKETKELLGRDYIVFTLTAMERPGFAIVVEKIMTINPKKGRFIVVSGAIDELKRDADHESDVYRAGFLKRNSELVEKMAQMGWLQILKGTVSEEGVTIGNYIRKDLKSEDSILVLGKNMSLNTFVYIMNEEKVLKDRDGRWEKDLDYWVGPSYKEPKRNLCFYKKYRYKGSYVPVEECSFSSSGNLFRVVVENPVFGPDINDRYKKIERELYSVSVQVTPTSEEAIVINGEIPHEHSTVYTYNNGEWNSIQLQEQFNRGGAEGCIYNIEDPMLCAKIFNAGCITKRKMEKLRILCDGYKELRGRDNSVIRRIAWPQKMLYASQDLSQPVGYIMCKFTDVQSLGQFTPKKYEEYIKDKKENQVVAAISLTELVRFLHENNVILCDINRGNILFDNNQRAYLVDLDSVQVTDPKPYRKDKSNHIAYFNCYPANVASPQYLSPEHVFETEYSFVHSKADDVWCLQYMIFLLLTTCGACLPFENSASIPEGKQDIANGKYKFPKSYSSSNPIPTSDPLYYMHCTLSRLTKELREAFFNSFSKDGTRFRADKRFAAKVWMIFLVKYYNSLPSRINRDPENGVYSPKTMCYESYGETATITDPDVMGQRLDEVDRVMRSIDKM